MKNLVFLILPSLLMLLTGIILLLFPDQVASIFVIIFAFYLLVMSVMNIFQMYKLNKRENLKGIFKISYSKDIVVCIISILVVFFVLGRNSRGLSIFVYLISFAFFITALSDLVTELRMKEMGIREDVSVSVIVHFILCLIIFLFPHFVGTIVFSISAICLIAAGTVGLTRVWYMYHPGDRDITI